jgi:DNA-binding winged helix-turn-helix (wHTH) protein
LLKPSCIRPVRSDRIGYRVLRAAAIRSSWPRLLDHCCSSSSGRQSSREELLDALWPDANVTETARAGGARLRQALETTRAIRSSIKTISRRGYRFVAAVEPVEPERAALPPPFVTDPAAPGPVIPCARTRRARPAVRRG